MKDNKRVVQNLTMVLFSNILVLGSSVIVGLVVPKILGVTNFGYYKIFTLYTTYTALLHFGFVDGILLEHGADDYDDLNKQEFRLNTKFFIIMQCLIGLIFVILSFFISNHNIAFILGSLGMYTIVSNITTYYQFISQATMRFKELSLRKVIQAALIVSVTFVLFLISFHHRVSFQLYIFLYVFVMFLLAIWYIGTYSDITFGRHASFRSQLPKLINYFKKGFFMTIAYQISTLIFNMDSQFISLFFSTRIYAVYAFAYSLIQMVLTVLNAISTVIFPHIKRLSKPQAVQMYPKAIAYISIIVFGMMLVYFPLNLFVIKFLPEYAGSIKFIQILFPGIAITSCITIITFNYYMIFEKGKIYTLISVLILLVSILINGAAYFIFKSSYAIAFASIIILSIWHIFTEFYLAHNFSTKWKKNWFYMLLMILVFLISVHLLPTLGSFIAYLILYILTSVAFFKSEISSMIMNFIQIFKEKRN